MAQNCRECEQTIREVWNKNIQRKRNAFKKSKEQLQNRSNTASQQSSATQKTQD